MKVAAITIIYNRLELTKRTIESFYEKTSVDYHLFIDNGSTDGTQEWIKQFDHILLDHNYGIAWALASAVKAINGYDYILKLDNDIETVTEDLVGKMLDFNSKAGDGYVCSPVDTLIDPAFYPPVLRRANIEGYNIEFVAHTGGAFQLMPEKICRMLCEDFRHLAKGDYMIGHYYRIKNYHPVYLKDLQMRHIGLNQSTPGNEYIL
jgi:GT2 family glycosyltransferase